MNDVTPGLAHQTTITEDMYRSGLRVTWTGMIINVLLSVFKLVGGLLGSSSAMVADAVHSLSDFVTDIGVLVGLKFLEKPPDDSHAYGHGRVETAISFLMGFLIFLTGVGLLGGGVLNIIAFFRGKYPPMPGTIALVAGVLSITAKEGLFQYTALVARRIRSRSLMANAWHHRTDALSSVATVAGIGGAMILGDRWTVLDPAAAVIVSVLIIKVGFDIGWGAIKELSDESLSTEKMHSLEKALDGVPGVRGHHHVRTRSLGRYSTVDAHILVDPDISVRNGHNIATEAEAAIRRVLNDAAFITLHVEPEDDRIEYG